MKQIFVLTSVLILVSCEVSLLEPRNENGEFDIPTYENSSAIIKALDEDSESAARTDNEYTSFEDMFQQAMSELEAAASEESLNEILIKYEKIVKLEDSTITPLLSNPLYRKITNPERLYISEGVAHKVIDDFYIIYTPTENIDQLREVESIEGLDEQLFTIAKYSNGSHTYSGGRLEATCPDELATVYEKNVSGCDKDRRVRANVKGLFVVSNGNYTPTSVFQVSAYRRTVCVWVQYNTNLQWQGSFMNLSYNISGGFPKSTTYSLASGNRDGKTYTATVSSSGLTESFIGGILPWIEINSVHHEGSSTGIGSNWAVVDCQ